MFDIADTIIARASAPGAAPRGIVRVSGANALHLANQILLPSERSQQPQSGCERRLWSSESFGNVACTVLTWPTSRSYTGQPVVEFHLPGSEPMLAALIRQCVGFGARPARPGEFTLRAFLAGRMDLAQCEGVLGVVDARNDHELTEALRQLAGGMTIPLHELRERLLELLAEIEAGLDFAEEDLEFVTPARLAHDVGQAMNIVNEALGKMRRRRLATPQHRVVLVGLPNVGKSSLFNALVGAAATIVSPIAGTTRDWVSVETVDDRLAVQWIDTAGYDPPSASASDPTSQIEHSAQHLARSIIESAELRLLCIDLSRSEITPWERAWLSDSSPGVLFVGTKADLASSSAAIHPDLIATSAQSGVGLDRLRQRVFEELAAGSDRSSVAEFLPSTAERCAASLVRAQESLQRSLALIGKGKDELLAAELRMALEGIGDVTGHVYNDEVLDRIFSRFCIGK